MSEYEVAPGIRSARVQEIDWDPSESNLVKHAEKELRAAGLFCEGSDYDGMTGQAVMELTVLFASQRHSGMSASMVTQIFTELAAFKTLTPLTDNPDEWMRVNPEEEEVGVWQNCRQSSVFSNDGGKTYYDLDERMTGEDQPVHKSKEYVSA